MVDANKLFQIKCQKCLYSEFSSGLTADLKHLTEVKVCATCHGKRRFRCRKCGGLMLMKRLAGNNDVKPTGGNEETIQDQG